MSANKMSPLGTVKKQGFQLQSDVVVAVNTLIISWIKEENGWTDVCTCGCRLTDMLSLGQFQLKGI